MRESLSRLRNVVKGTGRVEFEDEPLDAGSIDVVIIIAGLAIAIAVAIWWLMV
jgi:hypothetical protein